MVLLLRLLLVAVRFGDANSGRTEDAGEDVEVVNAEERRQLRVLDADRDDGSCWGGCWPGDVDDQDHGKNAEGAT